MVELVECPICTARGGRLKVGCLLCGREDRKYKCGPVTEDEAAAYRLGGMHGVRDFWGSYERPTS